MSDQTLSRIDLDINNIGDEGARYLADALKHNSVSLELMEGIAEVIVACSIRH